MKKPLSVKFILTITLLQICFLGLWVGVLLFFANVQPTQAGLQAFRDGLAKGSGVRLATLSGSEASELIGYVTLPGLLPFFMWYAVQRRSLRFIRVLAALQVLWGVARWSLPVIPLLLLDLAFLKSTKSYCNDHEKNRSALDAPT